MLGFALPSLSHSPSLPFYSVQRLFYLYCIAEVCFGSKAFLFLSVEWATWRIRIIAQNLSGEAGPGIQLGNKEILGDLKRRNEVGKRLCQTFALQLDATQVEKGDVWMCCSGTLWDEYWVPLFLVFC